MRLSMKMLRKVEQINDCCIFGKKHDPVYLCVKTICPGALDFTLTLGYSFGSKVISWNVHNSLCVCERERERERVREREGCMDFFMFACL